MIKSMARALAPMRTVENTPAVGLTMVDTARALAYSRTVGNTSNVGTYADGKMHGEGMYTFEDGRKYVGTLLSRAQ